MSFDQGRGFLQKPTKNENWTSSQRDIETVITGGTMGPEAWADNCERRGRCTDEIVQRTEKAAHAILFANSKSFLSGKCLPALKVGGSARYRGAKARAIAAESLPAQTRSFFIPIYEEFYCQGGRPFPLISCTGQPIVDDLSARTLANLKS